MKQDCVCICTEGERGVAWVIGGILSNSWAALWLLIGSLSDWIVNMEHLCASGGVYILCLIYLMLSHGQPDYYTMRSTIKRKKGSWGRKSHLLQLTMHLHTRYRFHLCLKTSHAWGTLSFGFHPEFSIKIIQRLHFITWAWGSLQAIKLLPVSVEMFLRWTSGVEETVHEMKCPWLSALPFVQKGPRVLESMHSKEYVSMDCNKLVWTLNRNRKSALKVRHKVCHATSEKSQK